MVLDGQQRAIKQVLQNAWRGARLVCLCALCGCMLLRDRGPVAKDVADCRKLSQRGVQALQRGDLPVAESLLQRAVTTNPRDPQAQQLLSEALWKQGQFTAATQAAEAAWRLSPDDPLMAVRLGEQYLDMGRGKDAELLAIEAIDLQPQCSAAWGLKARALAVQGNLETALADAQRALQTDPRNQRLLLETAEIQRRLARPQRALAALGTLRETYVLGEEPAQLLALEATAYEALGRHREAALAWNQVVVKAPSAANWLSLAESQRLANQPEAAAFSLARGRELESSQPAFVAAAPVPIQAPNLPQIRR